MGLCVNRAGNPEKGKRNEPTKGEKLMLGDILFYSGNSEFDRLIQLWTRSPLNHCAIDMGDGFKIEAQPSGIERNPVNNAIPIKVWSYTENVKDRDPKDMQNAVGWVFSMIGRRYGWSDILTAVNELQGIIYTVRPGYYDCSALATQFLIIAGGVDLGELETDPHLATPASLARQLKIA